MVVWALIVVSVIIPLHSVGDLSAKMPKLTIVMSKRS